MPTALLLILVSMLMAAPALAQNAPPANLNAAPYPACFNQSVQICGKQVKVPNGYIFNTVRLKVPLPYKREPFTVRCTYAFNRAFYEIIEQSFVTCTLLTCSPSKVTLCGVEFDMPGGTVVGKDIEMTIPATTIASPISPPPSNLRATCVADDNDNVFYRTPDDKRVSCNVFPCPDAKLRICDFDVEVKGGAPLGAVQTFAMPPPFVPDQFRVQCLGSQGKAPAYQVTDVTAVSCKRAQ